MRSSLAVSKSITKAWARRLPKWPWHNYLTVEESEILNQAEAAKAVWKSLNLERAAIINRAIQRAKVDAARQAKKNRAKKSRP